MNSYLVSIIVCPACKANLRLEENQLICENVACLTQFRIENGIPIMLLENKRKPQIGALKC